jgi:hypothetical protein
MFLAHSDPSYDAKRFVVMACPQLRDANVASDPVTWRTPASRQLDGSILIFIGVSLNPHRAGSTRIGLG